MGLLLGALSTILLAGCEPQPQPRQTFPDPLSRTSSSSGSKSSSNPGSKSSSSTPVNNTVRPVNLRWPITNAGGNWTIRAYTFYSLAGQPSAAKQADDMADYYRKQGREAWVTDMGNRAILSVGSFTDSKDPRLTAAWKQEYTDYLKIHGGRASDFQKQLDSYYEGSGALGDQPWPVDLKVLQMKMKLTQGKITQEEFNRYMESAMGKRPAGATN